MAALSAPNAALWRTSPYRFTGYLYIDRPEVVFKARVNQASFAYPLVQVTFDGITVGAYTDVKKNFTVLFGSTDGASDLGMQRARLAPTSTILYIGESSQGDREGEVDLADNAYITVLVERRIWGVPPRFDPDSAIAYKDYEILVSSGGRNYATHPGPKANGGAWRIALVDSVTGLATFDFTDESIYVTPGSAFASRVWDKKDGTITVGTSTSASPTMTFGVGRRYVELTVTDSNGHTDTHYILVVALSLTDVTWKPIRQFEITSQRFTSVGGEMSVVVHEDIPATTYYEGAAVFYFETEIFGTTEGSLAGPSTLKQVKFTGWLDTERESPTATLRGIEKGVELHCISAAERLRQINLLPQLLKYKASPDEWDELSSLTNARVLWYLLRWHSTVLDLMPLLLSVNVWDSVIRRWATTASTLYDQAVEAAKARAQLFTCDSRGVLRIVQNSFILSSLTGERASTVIVALTEADYSAIDLERNPHPGTYWIDGSAITIGSDAEDIVPLFARAPGDAPGQGAQRTSFAGLIVDGQDDLNVWTGNEYARINAPWLPVRLRMRYTGDAGIDPALGEWITLTLPSTTNRRARSFSTQRCMPVEVSIAHSNDAAGTKEVDIVAVVETDGSPAATVTIPKGASNVTIYGTVDAIPATLPPVSPTYPGQAGLWLHRGVKRMAGIDENGYLYLTENFDRPSSAGGPTWSNVNLGLTGNLYDCVVNAFSPGYLSTGAEVNVWAYTSANIYRIVDIFDRGSGRTITAQNATAATAAFPAVDSPFSAAGFIAAAAHPTNGAVSVYHSEDNGATWNLTAVTANTGNLNNGVYDIFYCTRIHRIYIGAFSAANTGDLYKSDDSGATWDRVTTFADMKELDSIHVPWHDNASAELVYFSTVVSASVRRLYRYTVGGTRTDITPTAGGVNMIPMGHWGLTSDANNRLRMAMMGLTPSAPLVNHLFTSVDGGTTWTQRQSSTLYRHPFIAGDDGSILYLWGISGAIGYSEDFGVTVDDRSGNIASLSPASVGFIRVFGG